MNESITYVPIDDADMRAAAKKEGVKIDPE